MLKNLPSVSQRVIISPTRRSNSSKIGEFGKKNVNGKQLQEFKQNDKFMDQFILQFSNKNQTYSIWLVVKNAINHLTHETQA